MKRKADGPAGGKKSTNKRSKNSTYTLTHPHGL